MEVVMKIVLIAAVFFMFSPLVHAQDSVISKSKNTPKIIEDNLMMGIESDNLGLKVSSAFYLGERKSKKAVIPLMDLLKGNNPAEAKIVAAVALFKIGDSRGIYALERAAEFDKDPKVRKICKIFHDMHKSGEEYNPGE
jgi:HEAT repeat protein